MPFAPLLVVVWRPAVRMSRVWPHHIPYIIITITRWFFLQTAGIRWTCSASFCMVDRLRKKKKRPRKNRTGGRTCLQIRCHVLFLLRPGHPNQPTPTPSSPSSLIPQTTTSAFYRKYLPGASWAPSHSQSVNAINLMWKTTCHRFSFRTPHPHFFFLVYNV